MADIADMSPEERFQLLDQMATDYFGTARWKAAFARKYGLRSSTPVDWMNGRQATPDWTFAAMRDAMDLKKLDAVRRAIEAASGSN
ncbi:hypothetical protein GCM10011360_17680 [Primorskyibacter flagellatus]|uniref:Uncharacterized protein n=1 Tax=Primorskyibacter flagellatus TaxID=1387277 RepID=A0A917A713_9RHOB|nr:hypothetical protein [Primorskyibacter flagellatus]GGE30056.1 hypothetical protein GCM10011360_17680 [Primorskyibacter flagellatus]